MAIKNPSLYNLLLTEVCPLVPENIEKVKINMLGAHLDFG